MLVIFHCSPLRGLQKSYFYGQEKGKKNIDHAGKWSPMAVIPETREAISSVLELVLTKFAFNFKKFEGDFNFGKMPLNNIALSFQSHSQSLFLDLLLIYFPFILEIFSSGLNASEPAVHLWKSWTVNMFYDRYIRSNKFDINTSLQFQIRTLFLSPSAVYPVFGFKKHIVQLE